MQPGRSCPLHYRYAPSDFARAADVHADTLYVIGGLYGNVPALEAVLALAAREPAPVTFVFNGDFNWFNIDDAAFAAVNQEVLRHPALRGNVETEMAGDDGAAGCGCAYPASVSDAEVAHSNEIIARLRHSAQRHTALRGQLAALPMHRVADVGGVRIAIVHGDLESLAGWTLSQESLARPSSKNIVKKQILETKCAIIASSHTCLPVALAFDSGRGPCAIFNNGAAGMPNFRDALFGVITRIATTPARHCTPFYGTRIGAVHVDALPVHYDTVRWQREFLSNWPAGSAAHLSYGLRMTCGPAYAIQQADRLAAGIPGAAQPTVVA
jgi:hypothetical protein